jgi:hypothetical protein
MLGCEVNSQLFVQLKTCTVACVDSFNPEKWLQSPFSSLTLYELKRKKKRKKERNSKIRDFKATKWLQLSIGEASFSFNF